MTRKPVRPPQDEIDAELQFHIEGRTEDLVAEGMSETEARRKARREFGDRQRIAEACLAVRPAGRRLRWMRSPTLTAALSDVSFAIRGLRRNPGFAAMAVLVLALGIGANVAVFSALNAVVLKPLPYADADRLVQVWPVKNANITVARRMADDVPAIDATTGLSQWGVRLTGEGVAEELSAGVVSPGHFELLGVRPLLGRSFTEEEGFPDRSGVVILSYGLWQRRFGGDRGVIGRVIQLDGYGHTTREVIGVMGPDYQDPWDTADLWIPLHLAAGRTLATDSTWYVNRTIGRLAPGATLTQASEQVRAAAQRMRDEYAGVADDEEVATANVMPLHEAVVGSAGRTLWLLTGAVGLVLVIACANVANLLLARSNRRSREFAVRTAIGASRTQLIRQLLIESAVIGLLGGVVGLGVATFAVEGLAASAGELLPRGGGIGVDGGAFVFALSLSLLSAIIFGLVPALKASNRSPGIALRSGGRGTAEARTHRVNRALVAVEVAIAMVLVVGSGLMLRSFSRLTSTDPGFTSLDARVMTVAVPDVRYSSSDAKRQFYDQLLERVRATPGVASAGAIHLLPLTFGNWSFPYLAEGHEPPANAPLPSANFRSVTEGYFETMGIPLLRGRMLTDLDGPNAPRVGLLNLAMAELLWPGEDPLGKEVLLFGNQPFTIVGVVGDVRQFTLADPAFPEMYRPYGQFPVARMFVVAQQASSIPLGDDVLRQLVWDIDADVPIPEVTTMDRYRMRSVAQSQFYVRVITVFGTLALLLGLAGVYGVTTYVVGSRREEFGVRMALGAKPTQIRGAALLDGLKPVLLGLMIGTAVAAGASRFLASLLYDITPTDPVTYAGVGALVLVAGILASYLPAVRASRVDPVEVLKVE